MPRKAKRRFLELQVDEVSVVDSPANEREFLVAKNLEEVEMGKANVAVEDVERVAVEPAGADDSVAKALQHVSDIVDNITSTITKKAGKPPPAFLKKPAADEDDDDEEEKPKAKPKRVAKAATPVLLKDVLKAIGLEGESMDAAVAKLTEVGIDPERNLEETVEKAETEAAQKAPVVALVTSPEEAPLTIDTLSELIQKAKRFTPERIAKLKDAYNTLKILIEAVDVGDTPKTKTPALHTASLPGLAPMMERTAVTMKNADGEDPVLEALAEIKKAVDDLATKHVALEKEVTAVKKARPDSNSIEEDATQTKKAKTGLWSGIL